MYVCICIEGKKRGATQGFPKSSLIILKIRILIL